MSGRLPSDARKTMETAAVTRGAFHVVKQPTLWFGVGMLAMLWFGVAYQISGEYAAARSAAQQDLKNYARVFEEHVVRTVAELDKALLMARKRFQEVLATDGYEAAIGQRLPDPQLLSDTSFQMAMIDKDGALRATTIGQHPPKRIDLADRAHFQIHKQARPDTPYISIPVLGRRSGRWSVQLTRRVFGPGGTFDGVVVASMNPDHFANFYGAIDFGVDGGVLLAGYDGIVRATNGTAHLKLGSDLSHADLLKSGPLPVGVHRGDMDGSGIIRMFAVQTVPGQPLFVAVGRPVDEVFSGARKNKWRYLIAGGLVSLLIITAIFASMRHHQNIERARSRVVRSETHAVETAKRLSLTLENMAQGLVMVGPDRRIKVINEKLIEMLELGDDYPQRTGSIDDLIGELAERGEYDCVDPKQRGVLIQNLIASPAGALAQYLERVRPDGSVLAIETRPMVDGGFVRTFTDITEQRRSEKRIAHLARHDPLTNLANRAEFRDRLDGACDRIDRDEPFALLFIDLDHFKVANDTHGHEFGDKLLRSVSQRLQSILRRSDVVARLGGDEFAVLLPDLSNAATLSVRANQIIEAMRLPFIVDGRATVATASIGGAMAPDDASSPEDLLKHADLALYEAKAAGRNCFRAFDAQMARLVMERRKLEEELSFAVARGQLELFYQPLTSVLTGTVTGFEALLRWNHPDRGLVPPLEFIPIAEESNLIIQIGEWVLHEACKQAAAWPENWRIAVNLSPVQFHDPHLLDKVVSALDEADLPPARLELEITESVMLQNDKVTAEKLEEIHALGVKLSMDDFGTGYSSLSYLQKFTFDTIKIDRSFITDLTEDSESNAIVRSIISLADCLGASTTAEGVETSEQLEILTNMGCSEAQGYLFSPPRPIQDLSAFWEQRREKARA